MKVSTLTGFRLDYWTALALGRTPSLDWRPSENWFLCLTFVETHGIHIDNRIPDPKNERDAELLKSWAHERYQAALYKNREDFEAGRITWALGPTPAVAACRCLVAHKYGELLPGPFITLLTQLALNPIGVLKAIKMRITGGLKR